MIKAELVTKISSDTDIDKKAVEKVINAFIQSVGEELAGGGKVVLTGLGTFFTRENSERTARNPQTGEMIDVRGKVVARFKAGKLLAEVVKDGKVTKMKPGKNLDETIQESRKKRESMDAVEAAENNDKGNTMKDDGGAGGTAKTEEESGD